MLASSANTLAVILAVLLFSIIAGGAFAQAEMSGWGNLRGIRVEGELVPIETSIAIASPGWKQAAQSAHWRTKKSTYAREGDAIVVGGEISIGRDPALVFKQTVR